MERHAVDGTIGHLQHSAKECWSSGIALCAEAGGGKGGVHGVGESASKRAVIGWKSGD